VDRMPIAASYSMQDAFQVAETYAQRFLQPLVEVHPTTFVWRFLQPLVEVHPTTFVCRYFKCAMMVAICMPLVRTPLETGPTMVAEVFVRERITS